MAKKARTHFVIRVGPRRKRLLSVIERRSGDLVVLDASFVGTEANVGAEQGKIRQSRWSIHVSPKASFHTLKKTVEADHFGTQNITLRVRPTDDLRILFEVSCLPNLDRAHFNYSYNLNDHHLEFDPIDPSKFTTIMLLGISYKNSHWPKVRDEITWLTANFSAFTLRVGIVHVPLPAPQRGHSARVGTSYLLEKPEVFDADATWTIDSWDVNELSKAALELLDTSATKLAEEVERIMSSIAPVSVTMKLVINAQARKYSARGR